MPVSTNTMPLYEGLEHLWTSIWGNEFPTISKNNHICGYIHVLLSGLK